MYLPHDFLKFRKNTSFLHYSLLYSPPSDERKKTIFIKRLTSLKVGECWQFTKGNIFGFFNFTYLQRNNTAAIRKAEGVGWAFNGLSVTQLHTYSYSFSQGNCQLKTLNLLQCRQEIAPISPSTIAFGWILSDNFCF